MDKLFIVANLKSYKSQVEAEDWLNNFKINSTKIDYTKKEVIICPPFQLLSVFYSYIKTNGLGAKIGAQNVSPFGEGAYTGEVNAKQLKDYCEYVIIGHSERRQYFKEDDDMLKNKVLSSWSKGVIPIFCVQNENTPLPDEVSIAAYEPTFAIGSGTPDTPENAEVVARSIRAKKNNLTVLYGGSVDSMNVKNFTSKENIGGVLVGGASLDPLEFIRIVENA